MKPILGILGGMGPQASQHFYRLLIECSVKDHGAVSNADFPHLLIDSIPVPDLVTSQEEREQGLRMVEQEAERLSKAGATLLAMPCNTMHLYADRYERAAGMPLLSMVDAVVAEVRKDGCKRVGLLGSVTTMRSDLYTAPLRGYGIDVLLPDATEQAVLGSSIHSVIAGRAGEPERVHLSSVVESLVSQGCEAVILGCTELPLLAKDLPLPITVYDSLRILAKCCCASLYPSPS